MEAKKQVDEACLQRIMNPAQSSQAGFVGIPVRVENQSSIGCSGAVTLKHVQTDETKYVIFNFIGPGDFGRATANMTSLPDFIGDYFEARSGESWGPASVRFPRGQSSVLIQLLEP